MKTREEAESAIKVLELDGDLTIENMQELHQILLDSLKNCHELSLSFAKVTAVDFSFVQLLCAAHRAAVRAEKVMRLPGECPEALRTVVRESGFMREQGCVLDTQGSCLWKERWE
jgi:ABC-type transporter Mla MlaB component